MAPLTTTSQDPRTQKALALAATAGQWIRVTDRASGRRLYGIAAACKPGLVYLVSRDSCTCPDATYRRLVCKHQLACRLMVTASAAVEENDRRQACGVCDVVHSCDHCPRLQSCDCSPRRGRVPLVARLAV